MYNSTVCVPFDCDICLGSDMYVLCVGFHDPCAEPTQHITPTDDPRIEGKGGKEKTLHTRSHFRFGTLRPGGDPYGVCMYIQVQYSTDIGRAWGTSR